MITQIFYYFQIEFTNQPRSFMSQSNRAAGNICKTLDPFFHINIQNPSHHPTYQVGPLFNGDGAHSDFLEILVYEFDHRWSNTSVLPSKHYCLFIK